MGLETAKEALGGLCLFFLAARPARQCRRVQMAIIERRGILRAVRGSFCAVISWKSLPFFF